MKLDLPAYSLKIISENNKQLVFDDFRKKYVALTPEEYVRQQFAHFLISEKHYPKGLTAIEHSLKFYGMSRRADIAVFGTDGNVLLIVECKAPSIKITQKTFDQTARYNMVIKARFLAVTNGLNHYCCEFTDKGGYEFLKDIPDYSDIKPK